MLVALLIRLLLFTQDCFLLGISDFICIQVKKEFVNSVLKRLPCNQHQALLWEFDIPSPVGKNVIEATGRSLTYLNYSIKFALNCGQTFLLKSSFSVPCFTTASF